VTPAGNLADPQQIVAELRRELAECRAARDQAQKALEKRTAERDEALAQQTASAEVLQVINSSPGRLEPVFEAMLEKALRLCEADAGFFGIYDGELYSLGALQGLSPDVSQAFRETWRRGQGGQTPHAESGAGRVRRGETVVHILDSADDDVYLSGDPGRRLLVDIGGGRTQLCAALRKNEVLLGVMTIWRREVRAFTDKQIAVLQSFAAQSVIAMENARLLDEVQARTREVTEALEYQTATGAVLSVIASSPTNIQPVFDTIAENMVKLGDGISGYVYRFDGELIHLVGHDHQATSASLDVFNRFYPVAPGRQTVISQAILDRVIIHVQDFETDPNVTPSSRAMARAAGHRSLLAVPMLRDGEPLGATRSDDGLSKESLVPSPSETSNC
jgi:GAF domain-containing protein